MTYDDDDDWPEPDRDPESLERRRREIARIDQRRLLRWAYGILALLIVLVVVLALTR